jgi:hypothetical protein
MGSLLIHFVLFVSKQQLKDAIEAEKYYLFFFPFISQFLLIVQYSKDSKPAVFHKLHQLHFLKQIYQSVQIQ